MVTPTSATAAAAAAAATAANVDRHKKFYLCAAPRPPFDVLTESVLRGLGSRAEEIIETTLDRIQNQHQWQPKSGPGRKSNAEHAIHFYEHLLEQVQVRAAAKAKEEQQQQQQQQQQPQAKKNKQGETSTANDEEAAETEQVTLTSSPQNQNENEESESATVEPSHHHHHHHEHQADDPPRENRSDQCDVCNEKAGRLMVCTSCALAFHLDCVRPVATEFPAEPDHWKCAYCWLATEPKNSKKRRESAAAVRLMARLRNGNRRRKAQQAQEEKGGGRGEHIPGPVDEDTAKGRDESAAEEEGVAKKNGTLQESKPTAEVTNPEETPENEDKEDATAPNSAETSVDTKVTSKSHGDVSRKRKLALLKLADAFTGEVPPTDDDAGRGKRSRKQPTLFDPQVSVPARHWQSDEVAFSSDGDSDEESENTSTRHTVAEGDVWCSFCNDDSQIKLCCFCGCRRCYGKHKKSKLLICDECEEEYHTFCLSPPLDSPPSRKWYCPNCKKANKSGEKTSRRETAVSSSTPLPARKSARMPAVAEPPAPPPVIESIFQLPRKRGRPPKKPEAIAAAIAAARAAAATAAAAAANPPKRKRGRPPKNASPVNVTPPRKRGRPPNKPPPEIIADKPKPLRAADGRFISPKRETSTGDSRHGTSTSSGKSRVKLEIRDPPAPVIHVSRSGRTVKRTSFHDEIDEGDQHLRSERNSLDSRAFDENLARYASSKSSTPTAAASSNSVASVLSNAPTGAATGAAPGLRTSASNASVHRPATLATSSMRQGVPEPAPGAKMVAASSRIDSATSRPSSAGQDSALALGGGLQAASISPKLAGNVAVSGSVGRTPNESSADMDTGNRDAKIPRRKPGARECVQISRRFGIRVIPEKYSEILLDYCSRGKVEHLIRMRERLDEHSRFLELQLAGLEQLVKEKGESNVVVPALPEGPDRKLERTIAGDAFDG